MTKFKQIKRSMIWVEKLLKIALPSKNLLDKYEYFTDEDLGYKPNVFKIAKFEYFPLGMSVSKVFKKEEIKNVAKSKSDLSYDSKYTFYRLYEGDVIRF